MARKLIQALKDDISLTIIIATFLILMAMLFSVAFQKVDDTPLVNTTAYISIGDEVLELEVKHPPRRGSSLITIETVDGEIYTTSNVNVVIVKGE